MPAGTTSLQQAEPAGCLQFMAGLDQVYEAQGSPTAAVSWCLCSSNGAPTAGGEGRAEPCRPDQDKPWSIGPLSPPLLPTKEFSRCCLRSWKRCQQQYRLPPRHLLPAVSCFLKAQLSLVNKPFCTLPF